MTLSRAALDVAWSRQTADSGTLLELRRGLGQRPGMIPGATEVAAAFLHGRATLVRPGTGVVGAPPLKRKGARTDETDRARRVQVIDSGADRYRLRAVMETNPICAPVSPCGRSSAASPFPAHALKGFDPSNRNSCEAEDSDSHEDAGGRVV